MAVIMNFDNKVSGYFKNGDGSTLPMVSVQAIRPRDLRDIQASIERNGFYSIDGNNLEDKNSYVGYDAAANSYVIAARSNENMLIDEEKESMLGIEM